MRHQFNDEPRSLAEIQREIADRWEEIVDRAVAKGVRREAYECLPKGSIRLLGSSAKINAESHGPPSLRAIVYMAPGSEAFDEELAGEQYARRSLCPFSGACEKVCLAQYSGRMSMSSVARSRLWKTALYMGNRALWTELLHAETRLHIKKAHKLGRVPVIRPDGASDTGEGAKLAKAFPELTVYDYTKSPNTPISLGRPSNYSVTYSYSERTQDGWVKRFIEAGTNVAVVFDTPKGQPLPTTWQGYPVLDGDVHDERYIDPKGHIVGLRLKVNGGRDAALQKAAAFVQSGAESAGKAG